MLPSPITFHNVNAFHCSTALKKHTSHLCRLSGYCQTHGNAHMHQDMACENMNIRIVLALKVVFLFGKKMWINILKQFTRGDPPEIPTHRENHVLLIRCISVSQYNNVYMAQIQSIGPNTSHINNNYANT